MEMTAQFDRKLIAEGVASSRYLMVSIRVPASTQSQRSPANLALVLDRSGSMAGSKLAASLNAAEQGLRLLSERDHFALVVYDDQVEVLMERGPASAARLLSATRLLRSVQTRGSTDLFGGWLAGCREAAKGVLAETVTRVLLLTDGLANLGETDPAVITGHVGELRDRGVNTSTLGFGLGFNEFLLGAMADAGGGHFHYIEGPADISRVMRQEVGDSLQVFTREARLLVEVPDGVSLESLNGFTVTRTTASLNLRLGDLNAGQLLTCALKVGIPPEWRGPSLPFTVRLLDAGGATLAEASISLSQATPEEVEQQACHDEVLLEALELRAAQAKRQAYRHNAEGRYAEATSELDATARDFLDVSERFDIPAAKVLADGLKVEASRVSLALDSSYSKTAFSSTLHRSKGRDETGMTSQPVFADSLVVVCMGIHQMEAAKRATAALSAVLASVPGSFALTVQSAPRHIASRGWSAPLTAEEEGQIALEVARWVRGTAGQLVITDLALSDNWFAHWHAASHTRIASLAGVEEQTGIACSAFIAYELLMTWVYLMTPQHDERQLHHHEVRACLFDFCADRPDLGLKLQNMELCPECEQRLLAARAPVDTLRRLAGAVRELARPIPRRAGWQALFDKLVPPSLGFGKPTR